MYIIIVHFSMKSHILRHINNHNFRQTPFTENSCQGQCTSVKSTCSATSSKSTAMEQNGAQKYHKSMATEDKDPRYFHLSHPEWNSMCKIVLFRDLLLFLKLASGHELKLALWDYTTSAIYFFSETISGDHPYASTSTSNAKTSNTYEGEALNSNKKSAVKWLTTANPCLVAQAQVHTKRDSQEKMMGVVATKRRSEYFSFQFVWFQFTDIYLS